MTDTILSRSGPPRASASPISSAELIKARIQAEQRFPYLKKFKKVKIAPAIVKNKGGLGEFEFPDSPNNPRPGNFTIAIGEQSKKLPGGIADTIIADMVHAASETDPRFKQLKQNLQKNLPEDYVEFARNRYERDYKGKFSGSNFANFENFFSRFWLDGLVQNLLLGPTDDAEALLKRGGKPAESLVEIQNLFKGK